MTIDVFFPSPEEGNRSRFINMVFSGYIECRTIYRVYTPRLSTDLCSYSMSVYGALEQFSHNHMSDKWFVKTKANDQLAGALYMNCLTSSIIADLMSVIMDRGEVGWSDVDWIGLAQDRNRWRVLVNSILNFRVPWNAGKLSSGLTSSGISSSAQTHRVS
jgi:hypothetical protein